jgi:hypothetical protein
VTAMRPAPRRSIPALVKPPAPEDPDVLDDVIQRIEQALPSVHKLAAEGGSSDTPTKHLSKAQCDRAHAVFQDMKDNPLLNEEGDDICLKKKKKRVRRTRR